LSDKKTSSIFKDIVLKYLSKSETAYRINPLEATWFDLAEFSKHHLTTPLTPVARLLLTSDGSMTQMLENLTLSPISMAIKRQEIISPGDSIKELADRAAHGRAVAREAWLASGNRLLIYAHSILFASDGRDASLDAIMEMTSPLGRMLIDDGIKTLRKGCRIGLSQSKDIAQDLGLPGDTKFWGRYYKLSTDSGLGGIIFELFSPDLFEI